MDSMTDLQSQGSCSAKFRAAVWGAKLPWKQRGFGGRQALQFSEESVSQLSSMAIVHPCTIAVVYACTITIVHACTVAIVHAGIVSCRAYVP